MNILNKIHFILMSCLLFLGLNAQASEKFFKNANGDQAIAYFQDNSWQLKFIHFDENQWPELIQQKSFATWGQAQIYLQKNYFVQASAFESQYPSTWGLELKISSPLESNDAQVLWMAENEWNWDWELKYADWLQTQVDVDFFEKYKIRTDCADVQYYLRWIFSRIYKLPMASRLPGGNYLTHHSMRREWEKLATSDVWHQDKRFLKAMDYLTNLVYTHTLYRDSYPVALNATALLPGAFHLLISGKSGHTMVIYRQLPATDGVRAYVMMSTVPRKVRLLSSHRISANEYKENESALVRMRWPQFSNGKVGLVSPSRMPHYSTEQFSLKDPNINRILNPNPNWEVEYNDNVQTVVEMLNVRKGLVEEGYKICFPNRCDPQGTDWDNYSTPSRDRRILEVIRYFDEEIRSHYKEYTRRAETETIFTYEGENYTLNDIRFIFEYQHVSSDPNQSLDRRWPLGPHRFVRSILERIKDDLLERRIRIRQSNQICKSTDQCKVGSENFNKFELQTLVSRFFQFENHVINYAVKHPELSDLFASVFTRPFSDGVLEKNYGEWKKILMVAHSDPRGPAQHKEGYYDDIFIRIKLPEDHTYHSSTPTGSVITYDSIRSQFKFFQIQDRKLMPQTFIAPEEEVLFYTSSLQKSVVCSDEKCAVVDLAEKKIIYYIPLSFFAEKSVLLLQPPLIVVADKRKSLNGYSSNVFIYDLKTKKTVFSVPQAETENFEFSKDQKYFKYSQVITTPNLGPTESPVEKRHYFLVNIENFPANVRELKREVGLQYWESVQVFDNHILFQDNESLYLIDLNDPEKNLEESGFIAAKNHVFSFEKLENVERRYFYARLDQNKMEFVKEYIPELDTFDVAWNIYGKNEVHLLTEKNDRVLTISRTDNQLSHLLFPRAEVPSVEKTGCGTFVKVHEGRIVSQLRSHNGRPLIDWGDNWFSIENLYAEPDQCIFAAMGINYADGFYLSTNLQIPVVNNYFTTTESGLLINDNEIWLLK